LGDREKIGLNWEREREKRRISFWHVLCVFWLQTKP